MKSVLTMLCLVFCSSAFAATFHDVTLPDEVIVEGQKKVLNGIALRKVKRVGIPFKIYVGGLYLDEYAATPEEILESKGSKHLIMQYKRSIGRGNIVDGWKKCHRACIEDCGKWHSKFGEFKKLLSKVKKHEKFKMTFHADKFEVENSKGKGEVKGVAFTKNILNCFISKKTPPSARFHKEIFGIGAQKASAKAEIKKDSKKDSK